MTTLSVVSVRFEYACGHTALASLPRLKAESTGQRAARVKYEKAAATQRSCDFCPPVLQPVVGSNGLDGVESVAATPPVTHAMIDGIDNAPLVYAVTGDRVHAEEQEEAMTTTTTITDPTTEQDQASATPGATPALIRPKGVFPLRKLTDEQEREVTRLYAETLTPLVEIGQRFGIGQTSVARIAQRHGAPLRSPNISRAMAADKPGPVAAADAATTIESETKPVQPGPVAAADAATTIESETKPVQPGPVAAADAATTIESETKPVQPEPTAQPTVAPIARGPKPSGRRTAPVAHRPRANAPIEAAVTKPAPVPAAARRPRTAGVASSSALRRFVVSFAIEQVLAAESVVDALQQAQARGATEVTSIVRIA